MRKSKRFLSALLAMLMVFSACSVGFTAVAVDETSGASKLAPIVLEPVARPEVKFYCTDVTRIAKEAGSMEPGNQIVKATPSGIPETTGTYLEQAYAGETPAATRITFETKTIGVSITGFSCSNDTVVLSDMAYDAVNGRYYVDIVSGVASAGDAITFTVDYAWTDGKTYQDKCVTYVENIETGGAYARVAVTWKPNSGLGSWYRGNASASVRLLGKGVYYSQPEGFTTLEETKSGNEGYDTTQTFGSYNVATGVYNPNVASGFNTSLYRREWTNQSGTSPRRELFHELFIPYTAKADVYIDASVVTSLADLNLRLDSNAAEEYTRNNDTPQIAMTDSWVYSGYISEAPATTVAEYVNDATASAVLGYSVPAKADHGMPGKESNEASITGGVRQYEHLLTTPFTGKVSDIADGSTYTIINRYYSYFRGAYAYITNAAMVATPIVFHIVDKTVLREAIDFVLNSDPTSPVIRNNQKGKNPQSWYYKSGFQSYQTAYVEALRVLNNPKAIQSEIDAAAKSVKSAYNNLILAGADYTRVNELVNKANEILEQAECYAPADIALLEEAMDMVVKGYNILYQGAVDTMASNLEEAIQITPLAADYSDVDSAVAKFNGLNKELYTTTSWEAVETEIAKVDRTLDATQQATVDGYALAINTAIDNLEALIADFTTLNLYLEEANAINRDYYINGTILAAPTDAAEDAVADNKVSAWSISRQAEVDELAKNLRDAIDALVDKSANKVALKAALDAEITGNEVYYDQLLLAQYKTLVEEGTDLYNDSKLTMAKDQARIDAKTEELEEKYIELMASYALPANKKELEKAINQTFPGELVYYDQILLAEFNDLVAEGTLMFNDETLNEKNQAEIDEMTAKINAKYAEVLETYFVPADKEALKKALNAEVTGNEAYYDQVLLNEYKALVVEGTVMDNDKTLSIDDQETIDEMTATLEAKYEELMASYRDPGEAYKAELEEAIKSAEEKIATGNYADDVAMSDLVSAIEEGKAIVANETLTGDDQATIDNAKDNINTLSSALNLKPVDLSPLNDALARLDALKEETISVVTYVEGVLGEEAKAKYDVSAIEEKVEGFNLGEDLTILDNERIALFATELEADMDALTALTYAEYLDVAVEDYENTDLTPYTTETAEAYTKEYNNAKALGDADQVAINDAVTALANAKAALQISAFFMAKEGTTTVVDKENGIIYGLEEGITDLEAYVTYEGGVLEYEYTENGFGTGAVVNFVVNGEVKETYTILIYGDLTGDAVIDGYDYSVLAAMVNGDIEVSDLLNKAADIDFDGASDTYDLAVLGAVTVGEAEINQVPVI